MLYRMYFERGNREHIELNEWINAIGQVQGLQQAGKTDNDYGSWVGYRVNSFSKGGQFHEKEDRKYDAELYFSIEDKWKRVFYWNFSKSKRWGVITFEYDSDLCSPVNLAAERIAELLQARVKGEKETWYED